MTLCERSAERCDHVLVSSLMDHQDVHVAFDDGHGARRSNRRSCQIVSVETAGFVEQLGLWRIQVLGLDVVIEGPTAERNGSAIAIPDREDDPAAHALEQLSLFAVANETRCLSDLQGDASRSEMGNQSSGLSGSEAQPELIDAGRQDTAPLQVLPSSLTCSLPKRSAIEQRRRLERLQEETLMLSIGIRRSGSDQLDAGLLGERSQRFAKLQPVMLHDEGEQVSTLTAARNSATCRYQERRRTRGFFLSGMGTGP